MNTSQSEDIAKGPLHQTMAELKSARVGARARQSVVTKCVYR